MNCYIALHKKMESLLAQKGYIPLLVGAAQRCPEWKQLYQGDDIGNNISQLNDSYCELTGLYWMWKNDSSDIVGLVHYRRFFFHSVGFLNFRKSYYAFSHRSLENFHILSEQEAERLLKKADILVKVSRRHHITTKTIMLRCISRQCLDNLAFVLREYDPDIYTHFDEYLSGYRYIQCNMFIGRKSVVNSYCEWLFPLLHQIDERQKSMTGDRYHNREIGYFAEILFGLWLQQNHVKHMDCPVLAPGFGGVRQIGGVVFEDGSNIYRFSKLFTHLKELTARITGR